MAEETEKPITVNIPLPAPVHQHYKVQAALRRMSLRDLLVEVLTAAAQPPRGAKGDSYRSGGLPASSCADAPPDP